MAVSANNQFPFPLQHFPPSPRPRWGAEGAPLCGAGPGQPWEGSVGIQPICCSSVSPVLPVPSSGGRGSSSVSPGRPVSSAGGRTKRGWQAVKWLPVGQPCRLPALPAPGAVSPLPRRCRSSAALPGSGPRPGRAARGSPASRPRASGKVLRGDLLLTDPPQQQRSAARGNSSLISFFFVCLLLLSPFVLYPPSFLCRQLLPPRLGRQQKSNTFRP